jgi:serine/threonine-protein kinase
VKVCPTDHGVTGGVRGITLEDLENTPRAKRHLLGVTVGEAYLINGYLGSGGFGAVYRAEQKALGRDVALKILQLDLVGDEQVVQRFKREARTAAAILDPNVVTLFDYGEASVGQAEEDQVLYIAMELVRGPTLRQVIKREGGLGLHGAMQTGINILRGLAAAHQLGVVHRDLKPGNVLIDESKHRPFFARLFDFGIASIQGSGGHTTQMGQGGVLGTPKYMAPEQWRAQATAPCTDVYAFGVILAEMLLGQPPVPKMELVDMAAAHCRSERPAIRLTSRSEVVPEAITRFIQKCMAIDPRQRYGSAREALVVLEGIAASPLTAPVPEVSTASEARDVEGDISYSGAVPAGSGTAGPMRADPTTRGAPRPTGPQLSPPPLLPGTSVGPPPVPPAPVVLDAAALIEVDDADDSEVLEVHFEEPRRIWPWVLAVVGVVLAFVGWRLADALTASSAPPTIAGSTAASAAPEPLPVAAAVDAARPLVADAAPAADAAAAVAVDAGAPDALPDAKPEADQAVVARVTPSSAAEPDKARPPRRGERPTKIAPSSAIASAAASEAPPAAVPSEAPRVVARRVTVAGQDVTPKANPTDEDRAVAHNEYLRGTDAQSRGAPKSAQGYFVKALRLGLSGADAADAQRRLKQLADQIALEASEF